MIILGSCGSLFSQEKLGKKVLLLNSYHPEYAWTDNFTKGVESQLKIPLEPEWLYVEYLDGRRMMDNEKYFESLVTFYKSKYGNIKFDAIISCDDYALEFLMKHKKDIFKNTPVIFGGINDMFKRNKLDYNEYCGVFEGLPVLENLDLIIKTQKGINKIVILSDKTSQGKQVTERAKELTKNWRNSNVSLTFKDNFSYEEIYREMATVDKNTAYYILVIISDSKGRYFSFQKDLAALSKVSKAPIYGMWGSLMIGSGAIGGYINDPYAHGVEIAMITKKVLKGTKPINIKSKMQTVYKPRFDYNQLVKYNFDKKLLPKEAIVYFEPQSYYSKHKEVIQTAMILLLVLLSLIVALTVVNRKQKKHNNELNVITNELKQSNEHLRQFAYMTSHQLRSSAVNMEMLLNYFKEESLEESEKFWVWEKINKTSLSIQSTVDDIATILSLQKQKAKNEFEKVFIKQIFENLLLSYDQIIKEGSVKIIFDLKNKEFILTNRDVLTGILQILLENSIIYRPKDRELEITIGIQKNHNEYHLSMSDNGDGLPASYKKKLFQLYHRGHQSIEGKGLGLFMARLLTHSIHASIEYNNTENKQGTTFTLVFHK
jgi:signal transduction histidine kinase